MSFHSFEKKIVRSNSGRKCEAKMRRIYFDTVREMSLIIQFSKFMIILEFSFWNFYLILEFQYFFLRIIFFLD